MAPPPLARLLIPAPLLALAMGGAALGQPQVQLSCGGTVLESRGTAEVRRAIDALDVSLRLEAEGDTAEVALAELQRRLAAVRTALQGLDVEELQVSSPSTWPRPARRGRPALVVANLSVQGRLKPQRLQQLVRQVGSLPGVRLAPVGTRADAGENRKARRRLLQLAYQDALEQAQDMADAIGLGRPRPLQVVVEGGPRPMPMRAMAEADAAVPPFDPDELARPTDRLQLQVMFCAS